MCKPHESNLPIMEMEIAHTMRHSPSIDSPWLTHLRARPGFSLSKSWVFILKKEWVQDLYLFYVVLYIKTMSVGNQQNIWAYQYIDMYKSSKNNLTWSSKWPRKYKSRIGVIYKLCQQVLKKKIISYNYLHFDFLPYKYYFQNVRTESMLCNGFYSWMIYPS